MNYEKLFAERTNHIKASAIRELLKVAKRPNIISFGGGLPAPESFPLDIITELTARVVEKYHSSAFQYDSTEGFDPLREALVDHFCEKGLTVTAEQIFITTGSQGFLDCLGKVFIGKGDPIAIEAPTYLGAIQAFNAYEPRYIRMDIDDEGLIPSSLEKTLRTHTVKFIYLVPTFQNPSGRTISLPRRLEIAQIIQQYDTLLIEDDPYSALRYRGQDLPTIKSMAPDHVVYASTFSKIFAPGFRIGFFVAPEPISKWLVLAKQGVDLHTSSFVQALAAEYINGGYMKKQIHKIVDIYRPRQKAMLDALEKYFPEGFKWSNPEGGMFVWAEGPKGIDMEKLYFKGVEQGVAYVPGKAFFTEDGEGVETMRLNYTNVDEQTINKGIRILSEVIKANL